MVMQLVLVLATAFELTCLSQAEPPPRQAGEGAAVPPVVKVTGIGNPHLVPWNEKLTVLSAILMCGGFKWRNGGKCEITHEGKVSVYKIKDLFDDGGNVKLFPGDLVNIPEVFFKP